MVTGDKKFGVVSYAIVGGFWKNLSAENFRILSPLGPHSVRFLKQFFIYSVTLYFRLTETSVKYSTCMVFLCN